MKGGALLYAFNQEKARPTKDIDFLGTHISNDSEYIKSIFAQIATVPCEEDGILFDANSIEVEEITQGKEYHGLRLTILASLDSVRQRISMDIGFGDIVTPGPQDLDYPLLLGMCRKWTFLPIQWRRLWQRSLRQWFPSLSTTVV